MISDLYISFNLEEVKMEETETGVSYCSFPLSDINYLEWVGRNIA